MYSEKDGQVILTMSREDYDSSMKVFSVAIKISLSGPMGGRGKIGNLMLGPDHLLGLLDCLNEGNPNYTPYQVEAEKK